jgi:hypothetical protein
MTWQSSSSRSWQGRGDMLGISGLEQVTAVCQVPMRFNRAEGAHARDRGEPVIF